MSKTQDSTRSVISMKQCDHSSIILLNRLVFKMWLSALEKTIEMLSRDTPDFISPLQWPPNSANLKPMDYTIWGKLRERVYRTRIRNGDHLERFVEEWSRFDHTSPVLQLLTGKLVCVHVWRQTENILNILKMHLTCTFIRNPSCPRRSLALASP